MMSAVNGLVATDDDDYAAMIRSGKQLYRRYVALAIATQDGEMRADLFAYAEEVIDACAAVDPADWSHTLTTAFVISLRLRDLDLIPRRPEPIPHRS